MSFCPSGVTRNRLLPGLITALALVMSSGVVSSCMTPDINFGPAEGSEGGATSIDLCNDRVFSPERGETDVDCGGPCPLCEIGEKCVISRDCEPPPSDDPAIVTCLDGICALVCQRGYADCNGQSKDGCEVNLQSDLYNCGQCNAACAPEHASGQCMNGVCLIDTEAPNQGCDSGFANCNLEVTDGCEVDLQRDADHCGACEDSACSNTNGKASCEDGTCQIECEADYKDCDDDARANGCETRVTSSVNDCGSCDKSCDTSGQGWYAFCKEGSCGETFCDNGNGDCDGDGTCTDPLDTNSNCGGCGIECAVENGTPACNRGNCAISSCDQNESAEWADCDQDYATGCEVNTQTSRTRCGGCLPNEGGEGEDCTAKEGEDHVSVASCMEAACEVASCDTGWVDCDGSFPNGCEIDTSSDKNNCGGCAKDGGEVCVNKPHTRSICSAGSCDYSCDVGWSDLNNDRYEEESDGCEEPTLSVTNVGTWGSSDTGGDGPGVLLTHSLEGAKGTQRLVLTGVICRGNSAANCAATTATYDGKDMRPLTTPGSLFVSDSSISVFYMLDDDLPGAGDYTVEIDRNDEWGSLSVEVVEFGGAEQQIFFADAKTASVDSNCDNGNDTAVTLSNLPANSAIYAFGGGHHSSNYSGTSAITPLTLSTNKVDDYIVFGSGYAEGISGDVTVAAKFTGCYRSVMYAVGVRPDANY